MKHKMIKILLCTVLIASLVALPVSASASQVAYILKVAVSDAPGTYVRSETGANIGSLANGTNVLFCGQAKGQMLLVMAANGRTGYVYQGNLRGYGAMNLKQVFLTNTTTNVYSAPGSVAGTVGAGLPVVLYAVRDGWAFVRSINGTGGYIATSALSSVA